MAGFPNTTTKPHVGTIYGNAGGLDSILHDNASCLVQGAGSAGGVAVGACTVVVERRAETHVL